MRQGTVIVGSPEPGTVYTKTVTQYTTSGTISTTVTNYPTATQGTATVVAVVPAASQDACGNQGTQWVGGTLPSQAPCGH